jgi:hypothetical protein
MANQPPREQMRDIGLPGQSRRLPCLLDPSFRWVTSSIYAPCGAANLRHRDGVCLHIWGGQATFQLRSPILATTSMLPPRAET